MIYKEQERPLRDRKPRLLPNSLKCDIQLTITSRYMCNYRPPTTYYASDLHCDLSRSFKVKRLGSLGYLPRCSAHRATPARPQVGG